MNAAIVNLLARAAIMDHANPSGVYQPLRFVMMLACSTGELPARAAFMHHDDIGHNACIKALCGP